MKPIRQLIILTLGIGTTLAGAQTNTPGEQFKTAVDNYQNYLKGLTNVYSNTNVMANSKANVLKVIELYKQLEPPPAVPEEAREPFVMRVCPPWSKSDGFGK